MDRNVGVTEINGKHDILFLDGSQDQGNHHHLEPRKNDLSVKAQWVYYQHSPSRCFLHQEKLVVMLPGSLDHFKGFFLQHLICFLKCLRLGKFLRVS